jgi:hypothetical protein
MALPQFQFPSGELYFITWWKTLGLSFSNEKVRAVAKKRIAGAVVVHNNYIEGKERKVTRFRCAGLWYCDPVDKHGHYGQTTNSWKNNECVGTWYGVTPGLKFGVTPKLKMKKASNGKKGVKKWTPFKRTLNWANVQGERKRRAEPLWAKRKSLSSPIHSLLQQSWGDKLQEKRAGHSEG